MSTVLVLVGTFAAARALQPRRGRSHRQPTRRGRSAPLTAVYPEALELFVLAVRAGHLPLAAMRATAPLVDEPVAGAFTTVATRAQRGERFADALSALPERLGPTATGLAD